MSWAVAHVGAVGKTLDWHSAIEAVEIGNECDLFGSNGLRPPSYTYSDYVHEFSTTADALVAQAGMPKKFVQGATWCCHHFDEHIDAYLDAYHTSLATFSYHAYPTSHCHGGMPTLDELLDDKATAGEAARFAPWAKVSCFAKDGGENLC